MTAGPIGQRTIAWLDEQRLGHTPDNYAFAHAYLTNSDPALAAIVERITDGGVRIRQDEVDAVRPRTGNPSEQDAVRSQMRKHLKKVVTIAAESGRDTGEFGRELREALENIDGADPDQLALLVRTMIERTERAEKRLGEERGKADQLRQDLEAARDDAMRDALTGLPNRRSIERTMDKAAPGAFAFIDIDHFKSFNDRFGHDVGDRVLKLTATEIAKACRGHAVARWGGEEFCVHMAGLGADEATAVIEGARTALQSRDLRVRETDEPLGRITFSAGISCNPDWREAVGEADGLLYAAKEAGRNRTHTATTH